jgi:hypothetical protein
MFPLALTLWSIAMAHPPSHHVAPAVPAASSLVALHIQEGKYAEQPARFPAARIQPKRDKPLQWLSDFTVNGVPVFWMSGNGKQPVVDNRVLSDLERVDIFSLSVGEQKAVGRALVPIDPVALAVALIEAEVILTYVHIESKIRLDTQFQVKDTMELRFSGEHLYYTNEENRSPLAFMVKISGDGVILVEGLAP